MTCNHFGTLGLGILSLGILGLGILGVGILYGHRQKHVTYPY